MTSGFAQAYARIVSQSKTWSPGGDPYLYQESDVPEALWVLAGDEFSGKKANAVFVVKGPKRETKLK